MCWRLQEAQDARRGRVPGLRVGLYTKRRASHPLRNNSSNRATLQRHSG